MSDFEPYTYDDEADKKSKSAVKKEMQALQELGENIVELSDKHLSMIPLQGVLAEAIREARKMQHREARRRQLQFIGKQMRLAENIDEIQQAYERIAHLGKEQNRIHHQAEQWRDRLLNTEDKEALQTFIDQMQTTEVQTLRQLIRNAQKEQQLNKPPASARKLYRLIKEIIETTY